LKAWKRTRIGGVVGRLRTAQDRLIQTEGSPRSVSSPGIARDQNPLNFVNNFSAFRRN
jgi:hypothetical protein